MTSKRTNGFAGDLTMGGSTQHRDPDLDSDLKGLISEVVDKPDQWLDARMISSGVTSRVTSSVPIVKGASRARPGYQDRNAYMKIDRMRILGDDPANGYVVPSDTAQILEFTSGNCPHRDSSRAVQRRECSPPRIRDSLLRGESPSCPF